MSFNPRIPFRYYGEQSRDAMKFSKYASRTGDKSIRMHPMFYSAYYEGVRNIAEGAEKVEKGSELVNRPTTSKTWSFIYKAGGTLLKAYGYAQGAVGKAQTAINAKYGKFKKEVLDNE